MHRIFAWGVSLGLLLIPLMGCATHAHQTSFTSSVPFLWPVPSPCREISCPYGKQTNGHSHAAVDIRAPRNTPVWATASGVVTCAEKDGDYGRIVRIDHGNGYETWYAHLNHIKTKRGRVVNGGDAIGAVGKSGNATGYHLHYEVRKNGRPLNPNDFLKYQ